MNQAGHDVVDHDHAPTIGQLKDARALARGAGRIIRRAQDPGVAIDGADQLALVPDMIAGGDGIDADRIEALADLVGYPEAGRRVLAIDHAEIDTQRRPYARQLGDDRIPARPTEHIS